MTTNVSQRRILLVDTDHAFQQLLAEQIGPYGFEVVPASPGDPDVLSKVTQLDPALLIIAVDEPDKVGYSLCNKAKKGVAAKVPVILATATIPPEGFANHRKLKIHADEYIDKRGLNPAEVVGKIDNLIGLGDVVVNAGLDDELQIEDLPLDLGDAEVVEQLDDLDEFAESGRTAIATDGVDAMIEADLDGAFAAITDDEPEVAPARGRRTEPPPLPANAPERNDLDLDAPTNRSAPLKAQTRPADYAVDEPSMGIPEPIADSALAHDDVADEEAAAPPAEEWSGEVPEPIEPGDFPEERTSTSGPPLADMLRTDAAPPQDDDGETEAAAAAADAVPEPVAAPEPIPEPAPEPPKAAAESARIDLGLDEIAARADAEQSGIHDRRTLQKVHVLERENARLKAELEKARHAGESTKGTGREREFLHLREMIAGKDKEILELRDELVAKDRLVLDSREKVRQLQHTKVQLESKTLELEQRIIGDVDRVEALEATRKEVEVRLADATARLSAHEAKAKADADAHARTLAERTQQATQLDKELTATRARIAELEHKHAEALAAAMRTRDAEAAQLRADAERAMGDALVAQRDELEAAHARAIEELEARHAGALAAKDEERTAAVLATASDADQRIAQVAQRFDRELSTAKAEGEHALAAERARAEQAIADAARHAQEVSEAERARADKAIADAKAAAQEDMMSVVAAHQGEMEKLASEHQAAVAKARSIHESQLAQARATAAAERDRLAAEHATALRVLTDDRDRVQAELDAMRVEAERLRGELGSLGEEKVELQRGLSSARDQIKSLDRELEAARETIAERERTIAERDGKLAHLQGEIDALEKENAGYQEQVLKAYQKIKSDEATVARAKKAMAIALTLLDEDGKPKSEGA